MKLRPYPAVHRAYRQTMRRLVNRPKDPEEIRRLSAQLEFLRRIFDI